MTGRGHGRHDGRCFLAAVLTAVMTAPLVTRPDLSAVVTAVKTAATRPVTTSRRDGSCVRGFSESRNVSEFCDGRRRLDAPINDQLVLMSPIIHNKFQSS